MRVLVTGACGFVGPYLVRELHSLKQHKQANLEIHTTVFAKHARLETSCAGLTASVTELDVTDGKACGEFIAELKPDVVYHLAGIAFAPDAAQNFGNAFTINVLGPYYLCQSLADHHPQARFIFVSSGEVYGSVAAQDLPILETQSLLPANPYSLSKLQAEAGILYFARRSPLTTVIVRPFNHIGPGQSAKFVTSNFAEQLARIQLGQQEPVIRVGNLDARRDFTDVRDIVAGYVALLESDHGIYNLASGTATSIGEILEMLIEVSGVAVTVEQDPARMRPAEVPEVRGSYEKIQAAFGWQPRISLKDSLREVYDFWLKELRSRS